MKINQKMNLLFYANKQRIKDGKSQIYIRITIDGKRVEFTSSHSVNLKEWDNKNSKVKAGAPNAIMINTYIENVRNSLTRLFMISHSTGKLISSSEIRDQFLGVNSSEPIKKTICDAFDYHNTKMSDMVNIGKISRKTLLRYKSSKQKLISFMKLQYKVSDKPLEDLRLSFVTEFEHYLLTVEKLHGNTAHKIIKILKKIMNLSVALDWVASNPFNLFKCSYKNPNRIVLTQDEINKLMNKKIKIARLEEVRDVFIFCCYTGFAYTDIFNFTRNAKVLGIDGNYWLCTHRQKTGTSEKVPLLPIALQILDKYKNHEDCIKNNKLLPVNSNQRYNGYLKELADICGITKSLTTHIARHTFATTVTLANGVPIETVSKMLGHTSIKTTQIYAKVIEKKVSEDMEILKSKLFKHNSPKKLKIG